MKEYSGLKVKELQGELRKRGLKDSGIQSELVKTLIDSDAPWSTSPLALLKKIKVANVLLTTLCLPFIGAVFIRGADWYVYDKTLNEAGIPPPVLLLATVAASLFTLIYGATTSPALALSISLLMSIASKQLPDAIPEPIFECGEKAGGSCITLVTGANSGIGFATARILAKQNHVVYLGCRSVKKCANAAAAIKDAVPENMHVYPVAGLDLSSLAAVGEFIGQIKALSGTQSGRKIDLLVNNAGVTPTGNKTTAEGFEWGLGVMHFAHQALTTWLLEAGLMHEDATVLSVSSDAMRFGAFHKSLMTADGHGDLSGEITYGCDKPEPLCQPPRQVDGLLSQHFLTSWLSFGSYPRSKLANVLFAREISKRYKLIFSTSMHPGMVYTPMAVGVSQNTGYPMLDRLIDEYCKVYLRPAEIAARVVLRGTRRNIVPNGAFLNGWGDWISDFALPATAADDAVAWRLWEVTAERIKKYAPSI